MKEKKKKEMRKEEKRKEEKSEMDKEVVKLLIDIALEFGQEKRGSFFIVTNKDISKHYKLLYPDLFSKVDINIKDKDARTVIKKLAELDGAIIVDDDGKIITYGAEITKKSVVVKGHGTRHAAALGISFIPGVTSIISSEEDGCVRIFKVGATLIEINPLTKTPPTLSEKIANLIASAHLPVIGGGGLASIALGVNPLVAAIVFTGSYIATKSGIQSLSEFLKVGKLKIGEKEEKEKKEEAKEVR